MHQDGNKMNVCLVHLIIGLGRECEYVEIEKKEGNVARGHNDSNDILHAMAYRLYTVSFTLFMTERRDTYTHTYNHNMQHIVHVHRYPCKEFTQIHTFTLVLLAKIASSVHDARS